MRSRTSAVVLCALAWLGGCGSDKQMSGPAGDATTDAQGAGQNMIDRPAGSGGAGSTASGMDAGPRDAAMGRAGSGPAGGMDAAIRDAALPDAGGTETPDAGALDCSPEGRERSCGSDVGECVAGNQRCAGGAWGDCSGDVGPANELCDGLNNDCDDATDEGCPCGAGEQRSCGTDEGTCTAGVQTCTNGSWGACQGNIEPGVESCATPLDEDCDGTANEDCVCEDGATQACGSDVGACERGLATCAGGQWGDCAGETPAAAVEGCNSLDDDCDGATDEGCACTGGTTRACGTATGACEEGSQACSAGAWGPCEGGTDPADETCDGADEDCDGASDEGGNACGGVCPLSPALGTACDGTDGDQCLDDAYACAGSNAVECPAGVTEVEVCNGLDDDCAGGCDDAFTCCAGAARACTTSCGSSGTETCAGNCTWSTCVPPAEACDGEDDDCDVAIDEDFGVCAQCCDSPDDGDECDDDAITCAGCEDVGGAVVESCNGSDDDCDGPVDEDFGLCANCCDSPDDADQCDDDEITCNGCESLGADLVETCNGSDDDCDGAVDEGFGLCTGCCDSTDDGDRCNDDRVTCGGCEDVGGSIAEACNGSDDDCDGSLDEGFGLCVSCCDSGTDSDRCADDRMTCNGCEDVGGSIAEACNGSDDDCDGSLDEGFGLCVNCCDSPADADGCNDDRVTCNGCQDVGGSVVEACNGADDDCDTRTDEGFGLCTGCCDSPADADGCNDDQVTCGGCQDVGGSVVEACNGADDDCDTQTDEGFGLCTGCCDSPGDSDACNDDDMTCAGCQEVGGSAAEACNGSDDDCDTQTDEGFGLCANCCDSPSDTDQCADDAITCNGCEEVGGTVAEVCNESDDDCDTLVDEGFNPPILSPGLVLMFNAAGCPNGWNLVAGQADQSVMGHDGDAVYTETGGVANHTHGMAHSPTTSSDPYPSHQHVVSAIYQSAGSATATSAPCPPGTCSNPVNVHGHGLSFPLASGAASGGDHTHTLPNPPGPSGSAEPPAYREVTFCQLASFSARAVPAQAIAMFMAACGAGFAEDTSFRDRFIRGNDGDAILGETGGSDTHTHDMTHIHTGITAQGGGPHTHPSGGNTGTASITNSRQYSISAAGAPAHYHAVGPWGNTLHAHSIDATTPTVGSSSTLPLYHEMTFCSAVAPTCPPPGMIGFFPGACPVGWIELISTRNRLIRGHDGDANFGEIGGSATHQHVIGAHSHTIGMMGHVHEYATTDLTFPIWSYQLTYTAGCAGCAFALFNHTHGGTMTNEGSHSHTVAPGIDFNSGSSSNAPPWREYVVCSKN